MEVSTSFVASAEALDVGGIGAHRRVQHLSQKPQERFVAVSQAEPLVVPNQSSSQSKRCLVTS